MWVVHHWPIIEFCLLGWVFLSVLVGIVAGRVIHKLGHSDATR
jgi:hypothetical protein